MRLPPDHRASFWVRAVQYSIFDLEVNQSPTAEAAAAVDTTLL